MRRYAIMTAENEIHPNAKRSIFTWVMMMIKRNSSKRPAVCSARCEWVTNSTYSSSSSLDAFFVPNFIHTRDLILILIGRYPPWLTGHTTAYAWASRTCHWVAIFFDVKLFWTHRRRRHCWRCIQKGRGGKTGSDREGEVMGDSKRARERVDCGGNSLTLSPPSNYLSICAYVVRLFLHFFPDYGYLVC